VFGGAENHLGHKETTMMKKLIRPMAVALYALVGGVSLASCGDGTMEEVGEDLDEAGEEIEEEVEDLGD
jgi:predicted small secreted protein